MGVAWQDTLGELKAFLTEHQNIEVGTNVVSIPAETRADFYRIFDNTCSAFVENTLAAYLNEANAQGAAYEQVKTELSAKLGLPVETEASLNEFWSRPLKQTASLVSGPLFSLLQGSQDQTRFVENSTRAATKAMEDYLVRGYICWLALSILNGLEPDEAYVVPLSNQIVDDCTSDASIPGLGLEEAPDAARAEIVSFSPKQYQPFLVPKVIVRSKRLHSFVSLATEFRDVPLNARSRVSSLTWLKLPDLRRTAGSGRLWPDLSLYAAGSARELKLIADAFYIARPYAMVECLPSFLPESDTKLEQIKRRNAVFEPGLGSFVVSSQEPAAKTHAAILEWAEAGMNIHIATCSYEKPDLEWLLKDMEAGLPVAEECQKEG